MSQQKEYYTKSQISLYVITWNVAGIDPSNKDFRNSLFDLQSNEAPDLIVIGLQEIVDLNTKNIVIQGNEKTIQNWDTMIHKHLAIIDSYIKVQSMDLVGLYLSVYVKRKIIKRISQLESDVVKTGLHGTLGNKGSVLIRFEIDDSQIVIANCHLTAG